MILERELEHPRADLKLQPGVYSLRVASQNKFGKPASWSAWTDLRVHQPGQPVDPKFDTNLEPDPPGDQARDAAPESRQSSDNPHPGITGSRIPQALVPGLTHIQRGQTWRGLAWIGTFGGLGAAGFYYWQTGNQLSLQAEAATPLMLLSPLSGQPLLSYYFVQDRSRLRAAYDAAQSSQRTIGLVAGVLYLLQIADALLAGPGQDPGALTGPDVARIRVGTLTVLLSVDALAPGTPQMAGASRPDFVTVPTNSAGVSTNPADQSTRPESRADLRWELRF
jgi:hypothetical protein